MTKVKELHNKWLKNTEYKNAFEGMAEEFDLVSAIINARNHAGLTQEDLAGRMDTKQSLIARLESGGQKNITIKTLKRIAEATGTHLKISFE